MKEFWIFRKNGTSCIEDGNDIDEIYIPNDSKVEEYSIDNNNNKKTLSLKEEMYYEKFFNGDDILKEIEKDLIKVDRLLECQNILSKWEQNFIFGIKKRFNNKSVISKKQEESLNDIYKKRYINIA